MNQEKKKYRRRRRIFYAYAIMFIAQCIITTLVMHSSPPGELNTGILFTISFWVTIVWLFALIYLKEFIVGIHWKKVSFLLKALF
jgi:quinol-cytochrome oxidoreductase complex cytochrome b subunit